MTIRMSWKNLFCGERERQSESPQINVKNGSEFSVRNEFDKDYERIVYSSSVRRLQDKAQVFPLQRNDFTRTRLTHSMEVSSLGRSMAWQIADKIANNEYKNIPLDDIEEFNDTMKMKRLPSLVETACLVHDLGNPPFGHYGEDVIKDWFKNYFEINETGKIKYQNHMNKNISQRITEEQMNDFKHFDGNAQTIHILTKLQFLNDEFGANFTLGTLGTLMKYPWSSSEGSFHGKKDKFGYMHSEKNIFYDVKNKMGIGPQRHPATFIVEAADDIAYKTADIEDAIKKELITWDEFTKNNDVYDIFDLLHTIKQNGKDRHHQIDRMIENIKTAENNNVPDLDLIRYQNFKICVQGIMIDNVMDVFMNNYDEIMHGIFRGSLLDHAGLDKLIEVLGAISMKYCYSAKEVVKLELIGDKVITDLLNLFVPAILTVEDNDQYKKKCDKIVQLISKNFIPELFIEHCFPVI